ncbi:MAG: hypothetical protein H7039_14900 [Bryobacteraceae bacterium]|nr:hypothetical protein [Bryobacteraceae bacterium]
MYLIGKVLSSISGCLAFFLAGVASVLKTRAALQLENVALRHQIGVLQRSAKKRPSFLSASAVGGRLHHRRTEPVHSTTVITRRAPAMTTQVFLIEVPPPMPSSRHADRIYENDNCASRKENRRKHAADLVPSPDVFHQAIEIFEAGIDVPRYLHYPQSHRTPINSTTPLGRLNLEIRDRTPLRGCCRGQRPNALQADHFPCGLQALGRCIRQSLRPV